MKPRKKVYCVKFILFVAYYKQQTNERNIHQNTYIIPFKDSGSFYLLSMA